MNQENKGLGAHIPLIYHHAMLRDKQRMEGFRTAISQTVPEGGIVLELGGGSGVLSFFAAQRAARVYCVEQIPENAQAARELLSQNKNGERVSVICADAFEYLPPEPVDVVICEMLHVAMVREKQIEVIESFKRRYRARFGNKLPRFVPEAFIQGIQLISYDFSFSGYQATVPVFQAPGEVDNACLELCTPLIFQTAQYCDPLHSDITWQRTVLSEKKGRLNAVRFILKNILAIVPEKRGVIDWHNSYLILPIESPLDVRLGEEISVSISYRMGCEIAELSSGIHIARRTSYIPLAQRVERLSEDSYSDAANNMQHTDQKKHKQD